VTHDSAGTAVTDWLVEGDGNSILPPVDYGIRPATALRTTKNWRQDTSTQATKGRKARTDYTCRRQDIPCTMIVDADAHATGSVWPWGLPAKCS